MKSLRCFCDLDVCHYFALGTLDYLEMYNPKPHLHIKGVYGLNSDSDDEPLAVLQSNLSTENPACPHNTDISLSKIPSENENEPKSSTSVKKSLSKGDFVLVKLMQKIQNTIT